MPASNDCGRTKGGASGIRKAIVLAVAAAASVAIFGPREASATASVEMGIYERINAERTETLTIHSGLAAAARDHSRRMSAEGSLSHEGADERVNNAFPEPAEADGAPDNGFPVASWCENVTYTSIARSESEAAKQLFEQWNRGGAHHRCMMDTKRNVGGVGVYYDGESYWATFIAEIDETPPGGAAPKPEPAQSKKTPAPRVAPAASAAPDVDQDEHRPPAQPSEAPDAPEPVIAATAVPSSDPRPSGSAPPSAPVDDREPARIPVHVDPSVADADAPFAGTVRSGSAGDGPLGVGWQEVLGVAGVLSVASLLLKKRWVLAPS